MYMLKTQVFEGFAFQNIILTGSDNLLYIDNKMHLLLTLRSSFLKTPSVTRVAR